MKFRKNILYVFMVLLCSQNTVMANNLELSQFLQEYVEVSNQQLPKQVDPITKIINVSTNGIDTLTIKKELNLSLAKLDLTPEKEKIVIINLKAPLFDKEKKTICETSKDNIYFSQSLLKYQIQYYNSVNKQLLFEYDINRQDCLKKTMF